MPTPPTRHSRLFAADAPVEVDQTGRAIEATNPEGSRRGLDPAGLREDLRSRPGCNRERTNVGLYDDLVEYYRKQSLLIEVPGVGSIEAIYGNFEKGLDILKTK